MRRAMLPRRHPIAAGWRAPALLTLGFALAGCHTQPAQPPLSPQALAAVAADADVPREPLARAIDALFADPAAGETRALLIYHDGRLIAERYAPGFSAKTRQIGWSMSKTISAVLIGLFVADGRLQLDAPAPVPLWQRPGDPRGEITLRHLLQMRSGLAHREEAKPQSAADTTRMLFLDGRDDTAAYAEAQPLRTAPGRRWRYSTATTTILDDIAARALTGQADPAARARAMGDYLRTRLFEPAGLHSATAEYDAAGTLLGGSMIHMTARDWGRFGELLRNQGVAHGVQVVPRQWVAFMAAASPANPGYGGQLWRNVPQVNGEEVLIPGRAPASLFGLVGHLGQYVLVSPAQRLTLVRLGHSDHAQCHAVLNGLASIIGQFAAR